MFKAIFAAAFLATSAASASAQWVTQKHGGEFDDNATYIALTAKGDYALGFRCNQDEAKVILITPEKVSDSTSLDMIGTVGPKLRLKVDSGAIVDLDAELDETKGTLGVLADVDVAMLKNVRDAKSKVSAVLTIMGQNFHETTFNVRGSTAAIGKLIKECKLDERGSS